MKPILLLFSSILAIFCFIEWSHLKAHREMKIDVHKYCENNAEYQEQKKWAEDEW